MSTIDDLLSRRRRGALSEADERRLQMTVRTSVEHRLTLLAGEAFERAGAGQPGDAALVKSIVRQVEGEWSGTFQRVVARRRLSRWVSVPVLIAGVAAASLGGYRALRGPTDNAQPAVSLGVPPAVLLGVQPAVSLGVQPAVSLGVPPAVHLGVPPAVSLGVAIGPAIEPAAPSVSSAGVSSTELGQPALTAFGLEAPAAAPSALALAAAGRSSVPAPGDAVAQRSWRLPRPKPHAERGLAAGDHDLDLGAAAPARPVPAALAAAPGGGELAALPDLESSPVLFRRANLLRRSDWDAAALLYERLALRHSESREAGVAEMALAKHALAEGRARQALQWFEAYQRRSAGELAAEAVWGAARALESLGENERARELWRRLVEQYPASAYAAAAREQLGP